MLPRKQRPLRFLITAGGTREYIDPVRFISNASSGRMGYSIAEAALNAGHKATLITTVKNSEFRTQNSELKVVIVETAEEMFAAVKRFFAKCDCLIMAAAVSDYTPVKKSKIKIKKSNKGLIIKLKPTTDILKWAGVHKNSKFEIRNSKFRPRRLVVGFALEDKNLRANAERKLREKNLDMIIANTPAAIGSESCEVLVKKAGGKWQWITKASKRRVAGRLIRLIEQLVLRSVPPSEWVD